MIAYNAIVDSKVPSPALFEYRYIIEVKMAWSTAVIWYRWSSLLVTISGCLSIQILLIYNIAVQRTYGRVFVCALIGIITLLYTKLFQLLVWDCTFMEFYKTLLLFHAAPTMIFLWKKFLTFIITLYPLVHFYLNLEF